MKSGLSDTNPVIVAAFKAALLHQGLLIAAVLAVLGLAWVAAREFGPAGGTRWTAASQRGPAPEAAARRLLRIGFGILWVFDGVLQAQPAMAAGLPSQVIKPAASASPDWVQHVVSWGATAWSFHPVQAGAAAVWIQLGIGAWLIAAPSGWASRIGGLVSAGWGLVVWVFGEAFGGIFAPGLTFLFGAPGAVLYYCAAGLLIALPDQRWRSARLGRQLLAGLGLFLAGMAVLQAWPGRGFWQGSVPGRPGALAGMASAMAGTSQPHALSALVRGFASIAASEGFAVNLIAVVVLALTGATFLAAGIASGTQLQAVRRMVVSFVSLGRYKTDNDQAARAWLVRPALIMLVALCLADWVLIEDLGFLGGLGTDPNSMIPVALLAVSGYLALVPAPAPAPAAAPETSRAELAAAQSAAAEPTPEGPGQAGQHTPLPARLIRNYSGLGLRALLALWAAVIVVVGAGPMAFAQASSTASPILAQAIDGSAASLNFAAPAFSLTDQAGNPVSLASLRGKVVLLTFLDPVCTSDCPLIAQEFRDADQLLGASASRVVLVAIVANPLYRSVGYTRAFDSQEGLSGIPNWLFLTGSLAQLQQAWRNYGVAAQILAPGGMIAHSDVAYVIDRAGHTRSELDFNPGPGSSSTQSSFATELADGARQVLRQS
jgi:cytochrome oxidase Cu insertion factor (SCO1/SenC/PrrC family)